MKCTFISYQSHSTLFGFVVINSLNNNNVQKLKPGARAACSRDIKACWFSLYLLYIEVICLALISSKVRAQVRVIWLQDPFQSISMVAWQFQVHRTWSNPGKSLTWDLATNTGVSFSYLFWGVGFYSPVECLQSPGLMVKLWFENPVNLALFSWSQYKKI